MSHKKKERKGGRNKGGERERKSKRERKKGKEIAGRERMEERDIKCVEK